MPVYTVADTADVGCLGGFPGSRIVQGPEVFSPDGRYSAFAEIEIDSRLEADPDAWPPCFHTSRIYLTGPETAATGEGGPQTIHLKLPRDEASGNTVWVVDWSSDSRTLLFGEAEWQYETGYSGRLYWLHDTGNQQRRAVNHEAALGNYFTGDCTVFADVIGFAGDNRLVVAVLPSGQLDFEQALEEEAAVPACVERETRLLFDPATSKLEPLPDSGTVERYGRWE